MFCSENKRVFFFFFNKKKKKQTKRHVETKFFFSRIDSEGKRVSVKKKFSR